MDKYIGKRIDGRYEILELIGRGGMANVYRARDRLENTDVAVKILREEFLNNEELVRRFKNESKAISLLSHPNIVKVFDVNFSDTVQCIVMELIDGITLKEYMSRQGQLGWRDAVHFSEQILKALQHAHDRGIVHRDIKPQNIMLLADGSIKVMDFGIARFSRSETRTITDKAIGSVHYISPEQAKGDTTDAKADLYSVGVLLYEMLAGRLPFESDSPVSVAIKQISDTPESLRSIDETIPEALEEITQKAMVKDPSKRYQSAAQMLRDFEEFKKNPNIRFAYKYQPDHSPTRYVDVPKTAKPKQPAPKSKRSIGARFSLVMFGITLACVIGSVILIFMVFNMGGNALFSEVEDVDLPNFVGSNIEQIKANGDYQFKFTIEEGFSTEYGVGVVYEQNPVAPLKIKENGSVLLKVSRGPEHVVIPQVKGFWQSEAVKELQSKGLAVTLMLVEDVSVAEGQAYKTSPAAGTEVEAGKTVELYINPRAGGGASTVFVPQLIGRTFADAQSVLTFAYLTLGEVKPEENDAPKGTVIAQSLPENTIVPFNSKIDLTVSTGPVDKDVQITLGMPYSVDGNTIYTVSAILNGGEVLSESISGPTQKSFGVRGNGEGMMQVYVGGRIIYEIKVLFNDGNYQVLGDYSGTFQMTAAPPATDRTALRSAIDTAIAKKAPVKASGLEDGGDIPIGDFWVTIAEMSALEGAIAAGEAIYGNATASQAEVNKAASDLVTAIGAFNPRQKT